MSLFIGFGSQTGAAQDIANSIAARAEDELPDVEVEIEALNKFKVCGAAVLWCFVLVTGCVLMCVHTA